MGLRRRSFEAVLLIILNWLLVLYVAFNWGNALRRRFFSEISFAITIVWGLFAVALFCALALFIIPANWLLLCFVLGIAVFLHVVYSNDFTNAIKHLAAVYKGRAGFALGALIIGIAVFSAHQSRLSDDGLYYMQTMKWFVAEGYVKGISNLFFPLGLASSWHILQAVFSFSFLEGIFLNDLNGLLLIVFYLFVTEDAHGANTFMVLLLGILVLFGIPYLSASSPDLPILFLCALGFYLYWVDDRKVHFTDLTIITFFAFTVKMSAIVLLVIYALACFQYRSILRKQEFKFATVVCVFTIALIFAKNTYQTGYPLYPNSLIKLKGEYTTPKAILNYYNNDIQAWGLREVYAFEEIDAFKRPSIIEAIVLLANRGGIKSIFNIALMIGFAVMVLLLIKNLLNFRLDALEQRITGLCIACISHFIAWFILAPQLRFGLLLLLIQVTLFSFWLITILGATKFVTPAFGPQIGSLVICLAALIPFRLSYNVTNPEVGTFDGFQSNEILFPAMYPARLTREVSVAGGLVKQNLEGDTCWDSQIPCVTEAYMRFLKFKGFELKIETSTKGFCLLPATSTNLQ